MRETVNVSKLGQAEGVTAHQTCLSRCLSLGVWSDPRKEGECQKVAKNMSKKLFKCKYI